MKSFIAVALLAVSASAVDWKATYTCDTWCKSVDACKASTGTVDAANVKACLAAATPDQTITASVSSGFVAADVTGEVEKKIDLATALAALPQDVAYADTWKLTDFMLTVTGEPNTCKTQFKAGEQVAADAAALKALSWKKDMMALSIVSEGTGGDACTGITVDTTNSKATFAFTLAGSGSPPADDSYVFQPVVCASEWCSTLEACAVDAQGVVKTENIDACFEAATADEATLNEQVDVKLATSKAVSHPDDKKNVVQIDYTAMWDSINGHASVAQLPAGKIPQTSACTITYTNGNGDALGDDTGIIKGTQFVRGGDSKIVMTAADDCEIKFADDAVYSITAVLGKEDKGGDGSGTTANFAVGTVALVTIAALLNY